MDYDQFTGFITLSPWCFKFPYQCQHSLCPTTPGYKVANGLVRPGSKPMVFLQMLILACISYTQDLPLTKTETLILAMLVSSLMVNHLCVTHLGWIILTLKEPDPTCFWLYFLIIYAGNLIGPSLFY